ncbi:MAG: hypothetical protein Q4B91_03775 [Atopobiaceae bacterium]|nr:hypothetical protein [Atopobiaceae bacterium]
MSRTEKVLFRVSPEEKELIDFNASRLGLTQSAYLRFLVQLPIDLLGSAEDENAPLILDSTTWKRLLIESRRWGSNYNQGVRALNKIGARYGNPPRDALRAEEVVRLASLSLQNLKLAKEGIDNLVEIARTIENKEIVR